MNLCVLIFDSTGHGFCLYSELIDLQLIGELKINRASQIEFNNQTQQWEVKNLSGRVLFSHTQRKECIEWEHQNLQ
jgi:hypothetical protein